jgi:hypothetical protein
LNDVEVGVALVDAEVVLVLGVELVVELVVGVELEDETAVVDILVTCYFSIKAKVNQLDRHMTRKL